MLSTATALIQATEDAIFDDDSMDFARMLTHNHSEMSSDDFAKAIYLYSGIIASSAVDKATKVLLDNSELQELMSVIDEMETLRNEVLDNGQ
jgi:hypothetical protein